MNYKLFNEIYLDFVADVHELTSPYPDGKYPKAVTREVLTAKQKFAIACKLIDTPDWDISALTISEVNGLIEHYEKMLNPSPKKKSITKQ
jgi:hypothetical protein